MAAIFVSSGFPPRPSHPPSRGALLVDRAVEMVEQDAPQTAAEAAAAAAAAAAGGAAAAVAPRQAQQQRRRRPRPSGRDRARPGVARGSPRTPRAGHGACAVAVACASHSRIACVVTYGVGPRANSMRTVTARAVSVLNVDFCDTYVANALPAWSITTRATVPYIAARDRSGRTRATHTTSTVHTPSPPACPARRHHACGLHL